MSGPVHQPARRPIVVVGLMGSGKTSVSRLLARMLERPLHDSDVELEARFGLSAAQQAARLGAEILHDREADLLREAVRDPRGPVIAAAASTVEYPEVRADLRDAYVVWLDAPARVLADRMRGGDHRPHFDPDLEKMLTTQYDRRAPWFREVADLVVDAGEPTPEEIAETILTAFAQGQTAAS